MNNSLLISNLSNPTKNYSIHFQSSAGPLLSIGQDGIIEKLENFKSYEEVAVLFWKNVSFSTTLEIRSADGTLSVRVHLDGRVDLPEPMDIDSLDFWGTITSIRQQLAEYPLATEGQNNAP